MDKNEINQQMCLIQQGPYRSSIENEWSTAVKVIGVMFFIDIYMVSTYLFNFQLVEKNVLSHLHFTST